MSLKLLRQEDQIKRQKELRARLMDLKALKGALPNRQSAQEIENTLPSGNRQSVIDNVRSYAAESKKRLHKSLDKADEEKQSIEEEEAKKKEEG